MSLPYSAAQANSLVGGDLAMADKKLEDQQWPSDPGSIVDKREISRGSPGVGSTGRQGASAKWFAGSAVAVAHRRSTGHHRCLLAAVLPATTAAKALVRSPTAAMCTVRGCHGRLLDAWKVGPQAARVAG